MKDFNRFPFFLSLLFLTFCVTKILCAPKVSPEKTLQKKVVKKKNIKSAGMDINYAAQIGSEEVVRDYLQSGACANSKDPFCRTPLHYAAKYGYLKIAKLLIERGAKVDVKDKLGDTPKDLAKKHNHKEIFCLLRDKILNKQ